MSANLALWVYDVLAALMEYEDTHPKLYRLALGDQYEPHPCGVEGVVRKYVPPAVWEQVRGIVNYRQAIKSGYGAPPSGASE